MDQLLSLGHVSGATKILELARRGMTSGWFSAEKRAGLLTSGRNPHLDGASYFGCGYFTCTFAWFAVAKQEKTCCQSVDLAEELGLRAAVDEIRAFCDVPGNDVPQLHIGDPAVASGRLASMVNRSSAR